MSEAGPPRARDPVLSTLNRDGSRRRLRPQLRPGRFYRRRQLVGWALVALFVACPLLELDGKPLILLDLPRRQFTFFGSTLLATDTVLLMLFLVAGAAAILLVTALYGRIWCGWACPQTVYMELVFRPLERFLEGRAKRRRRRRWLVVKHGVFLLLALLLAHLFVAYFVGVDALLAAMSRSPATHPTAFAVMAVTTALVFFDFAYFREQTCTLVCPYGRLQSVLLDRQSWIVAYDERRGEPRGHRSRKAPRAAELGHCIDDRLCVRVCPTGIDIRDGLQMECITCTQCIDACDFIMDKLGQPRGLVRYSSQDELAGRGRRLLRPRVVIYPLILVAALVGFGFAVGARGSAEITLLRGLGSPFSVLPGGEVSNQIRVKIVNRSGADRRYRIELLARRARLIAPQNPLPVADGKAATALLFVTAPRGSFSAGERRIKLRISDGAELRVEHSYRLLGPDAGPQEAP